MKRLYRAVIKKLEDPRFMRSFAGWNVIFWIVLIPISIVTGWVHSSAFISYLSEIALVLSSLSWWQSGRVEVKQEADSNNDGVCDFCGHEVNGGGDGGGDAS